MVLLQTQEIFSLLFQESLILQSLKKILEHIMMEMYMKNRELNLHLREQNVFMKSTVID